MPTAAVLAGNDANLGSSSGVPVSSRGSSIPDRPPIRRDADPYSAPLQDPSLEPRSQNNYAAPGWLLVGISVASLLYDLIWAALMLVGLLNDLDADALVGMVLFSVWAMVSMIVHGLMLVAGLRMTQRRSLGTARLGAYMGLLPCGICSILQIPFAVWAIVVLHNASAAQDFSE